jgi:hypothetical protein
MMRVSERARCVPPPLRYHLVVTNNFNRHSPSQCAPSPLGDWWRKRGVIFLFKNIYRFPYVKEINMADTDDKKRQEKIAKMSLTLSAQSTFFTVEAVLLALMAFIWSAPEYENTKGIWVIILIIIAIALILKQLSIYKKIDDLFPNLE